MTRLAGAVVTPNHTSSGAAVFQYKRINGDTLQHRPGEVDIDIQHQVNL